VAALFPATSVDKQRKAFLAWCARRGIDATFSWTPGDDGALMTFVVLRSQRRAGRHIGR
jgi:hypothetical protein